MKPALKIKYLNTPANAIVAVSVPYLLAQPWRDFPVNRIRFNEKFSHAT